MEDFFFRPRISFKGYAIISIFERCMRSLLQNWHWLAMYESIFSMLGISVEYLSELEPGAKPR